MVTIIPRICRFSLTTSKTRSVLEKPQLQLKNCYTTFTKLNKCSDMNLATNFSQSKELGTNMVNRKMSTMTLYKMDQSPPARAVMMMIDLLGLDVKLEDLNPIAREQDDPEFVKMNPMRTIPILYEGDFGLGDSHAIMIYLLEKYGKAEHEHLYPKDVRKRAIINHVMFFECGLLFPRLRAIMAPTYMGRLTELSKFMKINMEDAYGMIEEYLSQRKFVADDVLTIADFSVYTTVQSLDTMHPADENRFPIFRRWLKTMSDLDVVQRINEPGGSMHGHTLLRIMDMNKENQQNKAKL